MNSALLTITRDGERTADSGKPVRNKILLSLSDTDYHRLRPHLEFLSLPSHYTLQEARRTLRYAYFLNRGLASVVVSTRGGRDVEAGVTGNEGFVGAPLAVGLYRSPLCVVMQIGGDGFRISAPDLETALEAMPDLQLKLSRFAVLQGMQTAQTAACNRLHNVGQRLARWLLMSQDRIGRGPLQLTHDFLATMLGTDRPSVTLAAGALQKKRIIRYPRGAVHILNRKKLEDAACACYDAIEELNGELGLR